MKQIKQYIQESILDDEDDILQNNDWIVEQWLKDNYKIKGTYTIKNKIIDVKGYIVANPSIVQFLPDGYKFDTITGNFDCIGCDKLTTLEGGPRIVTGIFCCANCPNITSLKGGPEEVWATYDCFRCFGLTSLDGAPRIVKHFDLSECKKLASLKGCPKKVNGDFYCSGSKNLASLKGCPEYIGGTFLCTNCPKITANDLKNGPKIVKGDYILKISDNVTIDMIKKYTDVYNDNIYITK